MWFDEALSLALVLFVRLVDGNVQVLLEILSVVALRIVMFLNHCIWLIDGLQGLVIDTVGDLESFPNFDVDFVIMGE